jgi:hypothetical protein
MNIVDVLVRFADVATGDSVQQLIGRNIQVDNAVNVPPDTLQSLSQCSRLGYRARESIEDDTLRTGWLGDTAQHQRDGDLIGDQFPSIDVGFRLQS